MMLSNEIFLFLNKTNTYIISCLKQIKNIVNLWSLYFKPKTRLLLTRKIYLLFHTSVLWNSSTLIPIVSYITPWQTWTPVQKSRVNCLCNTFTSFIPYSFLFIWRFVLTYALNPHSYEIYIQKYISGVVNNSKSTNVSQKISLQVRRLAVKFR